MIIKITCSAKTAIFPNLYSLIGFLGLVVCILFTHQLYKKSELNKKANLYLLLLLIYPFFLLGSKLFSTVFFHENQILSFRQLLSGGMSIHGAILLSIIPVLLIKFLWGISPLRLGSILLSPLGIGIFFIRIANTFNCELQGIPSRENDVVKILYLGKSFIPRFPIQILEGFLFLFMAIFFIYFREKLIPKNLTIKLFFIFFPLIRFFTDRLKTTPENLIENSFLLKSDFLSLLFLLIALILIILDRNSLKAHTH